MTKRILLLAVPVISCVGCGAAGVFAVANDVTGTIVNTGLIVGVGMLLTNLGNITRLIQGLVTGV